VIISTKNKIEKNESIVGICGKKLNKVYGKKQVIIIQNGNILFLTLKKNLKNNLLYQKMIQILWH
jgi:hypothetical protein